MNLNYVIVIITALLILGGLFWWYTSQDNVVTQLPNPASEHCEGTLGGTIEIVETPEGQAGVCHLPDGRECEEWELYRNNVCVPVIVGDMNDTGSPATTSVPI